MAELPDQPLLRDPAALSAPASPAASDSDGDEIPDAIEQRYGLDANDPEDAAGDLDGDGFSNLQAHRMGWPLNAATRSTRDSDGDGISDIVERHWQQFADSLGLPKDVDVLNPHRFEDAVGDTDGDGVLNIEELNLKLSPLMDFSLGIASDWEMAQIFTGQNWLPPFTMLEDADGDGLSDLWEYRHGFDLRDPVTPHGDPDADGLSNEEEYAGGTHPLLKDNKMGSQAQSEGMSGGSASVKARDRASLSARAQQEEMKALADLRWSRDSRARFRRTGAKSSSSLDGGAMSLLSSGTVEIVYEEVRVDAGGFESWDDIFGTDQGGYVYSNSDPIGIDTDSKGEAMTTSLIWAATGTFSEVGTGPVGEEVSTYTFLSQHSHSEGGEEGEAWGYDNWWWQHGKVKFYLRDTTPGVPAPEPQTILAVRVSVEWIYNESIQDWEEQPEQILEIRPYVLGSSSSAAEELTVVQNYTSNNGIIEESICLVPVAFKTYGDTEEGPDKAHMRNHDHIAGAPFGEEWKKCVSKVWDTSTTLNLIDYLKAPTRAVLEQSVKWKVDGVEQTSHEINYGAEPDEDEHKHHFVEVLPINGGATIDRLIITIAPRSTKTKFDAWYTAEKADLAWLEELPPMFSWIETTVGSDGYLPRPDRNFNPFLYAVPNSISTYYHPGAAYEQRSYITAGNHGHQVCFDNLGILITSGIKAGSADKEAPFPQQLDATKHRDADVKPFVWALQLDGNPSEGSGTPNYSSLSAPVLHEGAYLKKYLEVRPPLPNSKPQLAPGATP